MARNPDDIRLKDASDRAPKVTAIGQRRSVYDDLYHFILTLSWPRFFLAIAATFLSLNFVFATLYWAAKGSIQNAEEGSFSDAFFFSVQTLATIGYGGMSPASFYAHVIVTFESLTGMVFSALITGMTFSKFARPTAKVLFAERCVVSHRNGVPHLMFRMANWRGNFIVEAHVRVVVLVTEVSEEGDTIRRQIDLPLVRDRSAIFSLSFVVMHVIDASSPFYGEDRRKVLEDGKADILVALSGLDETVSQAVHARYLYHLSDIAWNARFVDVLSVSDDGTRTIDYRNFHRVAPESEPRTGKPSL